MTEQAARHAHRRWRQWSAFPALLIGAALPLLALALVHRVWVRRRALIGLRDKCTGRGAPRAPGAIVMHGVSLGEVALMRPLVAPIERLTAAPCVLTTTSETGWTALERFFPHYDRRFWPLDLPWAVGLFFQRTRPRAVVLLELELWPLALAACHARQIPVIVLNARCSERSYRGYRRARACVRPLLQPVTVLAQNPTWGARLQALGAGQVYCTGSLKADVVRPADLNAREQEATRLGLPPGAGTGKPVLLLASTSADEEAPAIAWFADRGRELGWRLVICPRHPERGDRVQALCRQHGLAASQSASDHLPAPADHVLIVDEIGRLGALYANAAIAVVGGSFGSGRGGQNMLEAAAAGCVTIVGPDTRNQPDGMALLRAHDAVIETDNAGLAATLDQLTGNPMRRRQAGKRARQAWQNGRGAITRTLRVLGKHL